MIHFKKNIALVLIMFITFIAIGQELEHEAPTLQVGLNSLDFTKGTLDPEVIAAIVAEKQREIKIKVIQNSFLKKLYGSGGTIYNYADNVLKGVIQEPDTDIRTRKIMESTVNLVFVYAFADYYLKQLKPLSEKSDTKEKDYLKNLRVLAKGYGLDSLNTLFSGGLKYEKLYAELIFDKDSLDRRLNHKLLSVKEKKRNHSLYNFMSLLIDIASEVVRQNEDLQDLGIMRVSYSTNYDYLNMYNMQKDYSSYNYKGKKNTKHPIYNKDNKEASNAVYKDMSEFLKKYTSSIGAIKYVIDSKSFKTNSISTQLFQNIGNESVNDKKFQYSYDDKADVGFKETSENIRVAIDSLSKRYNTASKNSEHVSENYLKDLETAINKLNSSLNYIKRIKRYLTDDSVDGVNKILLMSDVLYSLKMEVIPNIEYSIKYVPQLINSKDFITDLAKEIYLEFASKESFMDSINRDPEPFVKLISKLYEFDKTKTFSEYINLISLLDEVFTTGKFKTALSTINTFVKDYTEIATDGNGEEYLVFNVESFLVKLESLQSDKINRFQFHFTVGMNTTTFINQNVDLGNGENLKNISHFSEKIGLKIKLINRGDWLPKNPGETYTGGFLKKRYYTKTSAPKEPVISNWHLLIYGSGLLYTVINSSTNKEFDFPMAGIGTGITFFNDLDFNISVGVPILDKGDFGDMTDNAFLSFGFDIQIAEYLKGVAKKKRERKRTQQILTGN